MSEAEQDAAIGRMVKELADNKRKLAAMTSELERYEKAFKSLGSGLSSSASIDAHVKILQGLGLTPLVSFLEEYVEVRQSVEADTARFRQLGV